MFQNSKVVDENSSTAFFVGKRGSRRLMRTPYREMKKEET